MKTIKERAKAIIFEHESDIATAFSRAFALVQEIANAREPEPVGEAVDFNGWRIVRWKGEESSFPLGTKFYTAPPAPSVPVLTVECEPDYWSGGHYYDGTKPYIAPSKVWKLPIGTKLYTAPPAPSVPDGLIQNLVQTAMRGLLTDADMANLRRFDECCQDSDADGHAVAKPKMKRLELAGVVRSCGFGRHETTAFGDWLLADAPEAPAVQHSDDIAVDRFATAMKAKKAESRNKGRYGWDDEPNW